MGAELEKKLQATLALQKASAVSNTVTSARPEDMRKGVAIRDLRLTPVK